MAQRSCGYCTDQTTDLACPIHSRTIADDYREQRARENAEAVLVAQRDAAEAGRREAEAQVAVLVEALRVAQAAGARGDTIALLKVTEPLTSAGGNLLPASAKAHAERDARMAEFFAHFCRDPYAEVLRELASTPAADLSPDKDTQHTAALGRMFVALAALDGKAGG